ncbi:hypothetical protein SAMN05216368_10947 [Cryobacterium flavum]|uniref:TadE-like protein n=1 Tax=Cryobacterium flavum TaxID=1424659 RepID=A0A4R8V2P2_9MICO|nr:hypothetical protein [Cryobacterium flavum]TFB76076.1 hypothetical protein E3O21_11515 [Cryobacterium flavum]SDO01401.1 hypothetical protein SAMN05216368_10947 [Cryobacterium flavum]
MLRSNRWNSRSEAGSASLEFITAGMILLVPLVYLVLALSALQGGALAVEGAARQAARVYVQSPDEATATVRARRAVAFALEDYGLSAGDAEVQIECAGGSSHCLTPRGLVTVTVRIGIALPLVPDLLALNQSASVPMTAESSQLVSRFGSLG